MISLYLYEDGESIAKLTSPVVPPVGEVIQLADGYSYEVLSCICGNYCFDARGRFEELTCTLKVKRVG